MRFRGEIWDGGREISLRMVGSVRGEENISPDGWGQEELAKRGLCNKDHGKTMLTLNRFSNMPIPLYGGCQCLDQHSPT